MLGYTRYVGRLNINAYCESCNKPLVTKEHRDETAIYVESCQCCKKNEYDKGHKDGYALYEKELNEVKRNNYQAILQRAEQIRKMQESLRKIKI